MHLKYDFFFKSHRNKRKTVFFFSFCDFYFKTTTDQTLSIHGTLSGNNYEEIVL